MITALDPAGYRRTPWKNGGGVTVDIAEQDDVWRFGRTPITAPGPFSDYPASTARRCWSRARAGAADARRRDRRAHAVQAGALRRRDADREPAGGGPVEVVNLIGNARQVRDRPAGAARRRRWRAAPARTSPMPPTGRRAGDRRPSAHRLAPIMPCASKRPARP
jgi:hypothetical protein